MIRLFQSATGWARALGLAVVVLPLAACMRMPESPQAAAHQTVPVGARTAASAESTVPVWIVGTGIHTSLVFPYDWLLESGYLPPAGLGRPDHVIMSWGDEAAYVHERWLMPGEVVKAFLTPTPAVMEIIPVPGDVALACTTNNSNKIWLGQVPRQNGPRLAAFLNEVSETGPDGRPIIIGPSSWGDGFLLKSRHSYYFPRICNVWSVQALEACGCGMNAVAGLATAGIIRQANSCGFRRVTPPVPPWEIPPAAGP